MARVVNWESGLTEVVARHAALPFEWGKSDCFILPLEGIVTVIGRDPWPGLHEYDSKAGAARCLLAQGYRSLGDAFAAKFAEVGRLSAGRGDVAIVESDGVLCGAIFVGNQLVGKTEQGLKYLPREVAKRCFRVD